jgi:hypothetical protein
VNRSTQDTGRILEEDRRRDNPYAAAEPKNVLCIRIHPHGRVAHMHVGLTLSKMEATMRWLTSLLLLGSVISVMPALAQLGQMGPSGDFRVNDRPGTAPSVGAAGGPSVPPDPTLFRDFAGTKSPDEILKSLDKDLGKNTMSNPGSLLSEPSMDLDKDIRPASDKFFKYATGEGRTDALLACSTVHSIRWELVSGACHPSKPGSPRS